MKDIPFKKKKSDLYSLKCQCYKRAEECRGKAEELFQIEGIQRNMTT